MDARNHNNGEVPAFEVGGWAFTSRELEPSEFTAISDEWDIETEDGPVFLIDEEIPESMTTLHRHTTRVECVCEDWQRNIQHLRGRPCKLFEYCPWCGAKLAMTEEESGG